MLRERENSALLQKATENIVYTIPPERAEIPTGKKTKEFICLAPGVYEWQTAEIKLQPEPGEARVDVWYSIPSVGTFKAKDGGGDIKLHGYFDEDHLYVEDDERAAEAYPMKWGYIEAGRVAKSESDRVTEGSRVSGTMNFVEDYTGNAKTLFEVDPNLREELTPLMKHVIPIVGGTILTVVDTVSRKDNITEDEMKDVLKDQRIFISGAGPLGVICAKWLEQLGADKVMISDINPERVAWAKEMGLDAVLAPDTRGKSKKEAAKLMYDFNKKVKSQFPERGEEDERHGTANGPDVVIEFSGSESALDNAFNISRDFGYVVNAGYNPKDIPLKLGLRHHHYGVDLIHSQVGSVPQFQKRRNIPDRPQWDRDRLSYLGQAFFLAEDKAFADGRAIQDTMADKLITHVAPFDKAEETYHTVMGNNEQTLKDLAPYARPGVTTMGYVLYHSKYVPEETVRTLRMEDKVAA